MSREGLFQDAVAFVKSGTPALKVSTATRLQFYAFFSQATKGFCVGPSPSRFQFVARQKYNAWKKLGEMSVSEAKHRYVVLLDTVCVSWQLNTKKIVSRL